MRIGIGQLLEHALKGRPNKMLELAIQSAGHLDDYAPGPVPSFPQALYNVKPDASELDDGERKILGRHRADVTAAEAENASRLAAVLWCLTTIRQHADTDPSCPDMADHVARWADRRYPRLREVLRGAPMPASGAERQRLCTMATRDYVSLPREWRWT